ncbi:MAG: hypothetical protein D4R67_11230 [Bacteroidetes bacterium]|nr:MAG: hypothetical protein D4R67_11230 [Bacteroidota bacterium]
MFRKHTFVSLITVNWLLLIPFQPAGRGLENPVTQSVFFNEKLNLPGILDLRTGHPGHFGELFGITQSGEKEVSLQIPDRINDRRESFGLGFKIVLLQ